MPRQGENESELRTTSYISDIDGHNTSQESSDAFIQSSREESDTLSAPSATFNPLSSRPNTHHGAPSTWRSWMASERSLAASLDHLNAKDLAVHLYNAFALGQRAQRLRSRNEAKDGINEQVWSPPTSWTAWPLAPALVPAEDEEVRWESENYLNGFTSSKKFTPREVLEDILIGRLQKVAKERFLKRQSLGESAENSDINLDGDEEADLLEPVVMADDDLARNLTEPAVHHVFAKLDQLLTALHHARHAYATTVGFAGHSQDEPSSREFQQKRKSKYKSKQNESRSSKTKPRVSSNSSASQVDSELSDSEQSSFSAASDVEQFNPKRQRATRSNKRKRRYGLRDWSDVVGIAAMTNWEPKTVQSAASRCATLFDEGMKLRTLEENGNAGNEILISPNTRAQETEINLGGTLSKEHDQHQDREPEGVPKPQRSSGDSQGSRFYCPVVDCERSRNGFWQASQLTRHLKQVHKQTKSQAQAAVAAAAAACEIDGDDDEMMMVGGVHVDGFLRPVPVPGEWANKARAQQRRKKLRKTED